ncbi:fatty acid desaturase [Aliikangiella coralliicola]|uniref:Acyl-CoA desaturase n=1 Tax=Aliikangiella coralliicola TaxID=2592383 RepID=A0A545UAP6_9GAMM|nr:fatty acid desaturase [Aliikangiella coralliicola]TQV86528.1 acyl-CoA desaturase [Aliikangiella coralliicola]
MQSHNSPEKSQNLATNSQTPNGTSHKPKLIWLNILVFSITFAIALVGLPVYAYFYDFDVQTIIAFIVATGFCGMSITAGYHRLWSHRAYETNIFIRFIYAIGGAFAIQNSALHWSSDHRVHHRHVDDNDIDPYSAKRGFWYSHIGWMLREYQQHRYSDYKNVRDLQRDPIVMWQHRNYLMLVVLTNFGFPLLFGLINGNIVGSLLLIGVTRLVVSHHVTFFINSLAHMWGSQPYSDQNTAKDNPLVALLTYGEGYHNFHHAFQYDYRNAIKWWQFDPTKWFIKSLSWLGLAKNLKKISEEKINQAIAKQQLNKTCCKLMNLSLPDREEVLAKVQQEYDELLERMTAFYKAQRAWLEVTKDQLVENVEKSNISQQYNELKISWFEQRKNWHSLIHQYA